MAGRIHGWTSTQRGITVATLLGFWENIVNSHRYLQAWIIMDILPLILPGKLLHPACQHSVALGKAKIDQCMRRHITFSLLYLELLAGLAYSNSSELG
jgi:hypothetical protein